MFDKTKRLPLMGKKLIKLTGQETNKPAFSAMGYRQGDQNKPAIPQGVERSDR